MPFVEKYMSLAGITKSLAAWYQLLAGKINIKKFKYVIFSGALVAFAFLLAQRFLLVGESMKFETLVIYTLAAILVSAGFGYVLHYFEGIDRSFRTFAYGSFMISTLVLSAFLSFIYYPNLTVAIKIVLAFFYAAMLYSVLLLNNLVVVVGSREESIPVYRVALSWVQIVLLGVSISLFTTLFKINVNPLVQIIFLTLFTLAFFNYFHYVYSYAGDVKTTTKPEKLTLIISLSCLVSWSAFCILFFPTESFLRGIFVSSVFLLGLGYMQSYLKNSLGKRLIYDYAFISVFFFIILIVFKP